MTQIKSTTYPTIADKVQLFKDNGIDVYEYDTFDGDKPNQVIDIANDDDIDAAIEIAKKHGIVIYAVRRTWEYDVEQLAQSPYYEMAF